MNKQIYILNGKVIKREHIKSIFQFDDGVIQILLVMNAEPHTVFVLGEEMNVGSKFIADLFPTTKETLITLQPDEEHKMHELIAWLDEPHRSHIRRCKGTSITIRYLVS